MILSDYSARKRHDMLWAALDAVLRAAEPISSTKDVALQMHRHMALPEGELPMVLTWLKKTAPLVPEASQTGAVVKAYGRYGRRWIWSKRAGLAPAAAVVDTSEW